MSHRQESLFSDDENPVPAAPYSNTTDRQIIKAGNVTRRLTPEEEDAKNEFIAETCAEDAPEFWLDMCSTIETDASEYVNLKLNPESNTGYNGSHIWEAMYSENCFEHEEVGESVDGIKLLRARGSGGERRRYRFHLSLERGSGSRGVP